MDRYKFNMYIRLFGWGTCQYYERDIPWEYGIKNLFPFTFVITNSCADKIQEIILSADTFNLKLIVYAIVIVVFV